jgi:hypothetical protein
MNDAFGVSTASAERPRVADIETRFGKAIASIVAGFTDTRQVPEPPWRERKTAYVAHIGAHSSRNGTARNSESAMPADWQKTSPTSPPGLVGFPFMTIDRRVLVDKMAILCRFPP